MTGGRGLVRYRHIGRVYDVVSLERVLYRAPRRRLLAMIGPIPAATVLDVGCGSGLNFEGLRALVGPTGRVIGLDASASMLAAARRRVRRGGWTNVTTLHGNIDELVPALRRAAIAPDDIDVLVAAFVISIIPDAARFWNDVDHLSRRRPRLVALADLGKASTLGRLGSAALRSLAALGASQPSSKPWNELAARSDDVVIESRLGGHVRLAVGHCGTRPTEPLGVQR